MYAVIRALLAATNVSPTQRLRPSLRLLLLLPKLLQLLGVQAWIAPLGSIHAFLTRQIAHAA